MADWDPSAPEDPMIQRAAELLAGGGVVAFPTDTLYGLGADASQPAAIARIFAIKGRPSSRPLIVLIAAFDALKIFARDVPVAADRLAQAFWPGPLTLILPRQPEVPEGITAGGDTVGLRIPDHPMARALIRALGRHRGQPSGLAAPSANPFGAPPPTTAQAVREGLGDGPDWILDGGPCPHAAPSTIVDLSGPAVRIVREGALPRARIEAVVREPIAP